MGSRPGKIGVILAAALLSFIGAFSYGTDEKVDRAHTVSSLHRALELYKFERASVLNSVLAQEAFQRSFRTLKAWEKERDPETGLVPTRLRPYRAVWEAEDTAADLFPFLLLVSYHLDKDNHDSWVRVIAKEREICGLLPCDIRFRPARAMPEPLEEVRIFGASEYAKDGLLPVTEHLGEGPWLERLEEIMGALISSASIDTPAGKICSSDCEVNGEMLQVLSRLYWRTGRYEYLEMAERIGKAYLFEVFPNNGYLPTEDWNFAERRPVKPEVRLRDHGNEIIMGLVELYFLEKAKGRPEAASFREPVKKLLDLLLRVGRTEDGLWYSRISTDTHEVLDNRVADTWGYILNAYQTFDLAEGSDIYAPEIRRAMLAAASRKSFEWEVGSPPDGYADTIESMLYMLAFFDIPACHRWVDEEIANLFSLQRQSGFFERSYLDGNAIRTSLMYARYKTRGIMPEPWREDLRLGAAYDGRKGELHVHLSADTPWEGVLKFDSPRHRTIWKLPFRYPRLNKAPEWSTVGADATHVVTGLRDGKKPSYSGQSLSQGMAVRLTKAKPSLSLKISMKSDSRS